MNSPLPLRPGPGFIAEVVASTWLDGSTARILIGHPGVQRPGQTAAEIERSLRGLAHGLGLTSAEVSSHARLIVTHRFTALDYGHPDAMMRVPDPGPHWQSLVTRTRRADLTIGFAPLLPGMNQNAIHTYLARATTVGGAITLRRN